MLSHAGHCDVHAQIFVDGSGGNRHFHNMAWWLGRSGGMYTPLDVDNPVPIGRVTAALRAAIERIDVTRW